MKNPPAALLMFFLLVAFTGDAYCCHHHKETTIILLRHAEKDTVGGNDPPLSAIGLQRASRLESSLKGYRPDAFYSTNFVRTKATVAPWAKALKKQIEIYDASSQENFANMLQAQTKKTIVVVGHSNTIPALVNLLAKTKKYMQLQDNEFGTIFIVTAKDKGNPKVRIIRY